MKSAQPFWRWAALRSASSSVWRIIARFGRPVSESNRARRMISLLGLALLGEVGADAAEAEEAAALVEDRVAGQRPVDVLLACRADDDVGEGEARRKMEAERLALLERSRTCRVDRQQIGELAAEQLFGLALEIVGELPRDVGQGARANRFPRTSRGRCFRTRRRNAERLARLRFEAQPLAPGGDEAAGAGDAVGEQHQREDRDAGWDQRRVGEDDRGQRPRRCALTRASGGELIDTIVPHRRCRPPSRSARPRSA